MERLDIILIILGITLCILGVFSLFARNKAQLRRRRTKKIYYFKPSAVIPFSLGIIMLLASYLSIQSKTNPSNFFRQLLSNGTNDLHHPKTETIQNDNESDTSTVEGEAELADINEGILTQDEPLVNKLEQTTTLTMSEESKLQAKPSSLFPTGSWIMIEYKENNTDLSYMTTGSASFTQVSPERQAWEMQIQSLDVWGNRSHYNYNGYMTSTSSGYEIQIETSNDPSFNRAPATDLTLDMSDGLLKLEFEFKDDAVEMQFAQ